MLWRQVHIQMANVLHLPFENQIQVRHPGVLLEVLG
jgi:hypothetical protein